MYPSTSNWNSADTNSAWVVNIPPGQPQSVCQTNGWNFLSQLQTYLKSRLSAAPSITWDGTTVDGSAININDPASPGTATGWNLDLLRALYAVASLDGAPGSTLSAIQQDAAQMSISAATLAAALWIGEFGQGYQGSQVVYGLGSVNEITIPPDSVLPMFGVVPPVSSAGTTLGLDCHTVTGAAIPSVQTASGVLIVSALLAGIVAMVILTANIPTTKRTARRNPRKRRSSR